MAPSSISVLVVDDYEPLRRFVCSTLQNDLGLPTILEASDGEEAVELAQALKPHLILLDIGMPKLNGIDAARRIRELSPQSKILFFSQESSLDVVQGAFNAGASGYVVKIDARELTTAVSAVLRGERFVSHRIARDEFAETSNTLSNAGHVVQFYGDDTVLLEDLAGLFRTSLRAGEFVTAVITSSHRDGIENCLIAQGIDVSEATRNGQLAILDADQALSGFMDEDGPNRERFLLQFGTLLRRAQIAAEAKSRRVVVFGEMVAVLWAQKKYEAAIRLEQLWNELAQTCSFYLCCAYPASALHEEPSTGLCVQVCAQHSAVVSSFVGFPTTLGAMVRAS